MTRVAFVGGFGSSKSSTEKVGEALARHFEDVDTFSFSEYTNNPDRVSRAVKGVTLVTHSAGALVTPNTKPESAHMWNPPLPKSMGSLVLRAMRKTARLYVTEGVKASSELSRESTRELVAHPVANFGQLPEISRFNAIDEAISLKEHKVPSHLVWTDKDSFFQPSELEIWYAARHDIPVRILNGQHDEVLLHPETFVEQALNNIDRH